MAFSGGNNEIETTVSTGVGPFTLAGAVNSRNSIAAAVGVGNTSRFLIFGASAWQVFKGTLSASDTLQVDSVIGGTSFPSPHNFTAGEKQVHLVDDWDSLIRKDLEGQAVNADQSSVQAFQDTADSNATGDGTVVDPVQFDAEKRDQASDFDIVSHVFTARSPGVHLAVGALRVDGLTAGHTTHKIQLVGTDYTLSVNEGAPSRGSSDQQVFPFCGLMYLDAGDTLKATAQISGSTKVVTLAGDIAGNPTCHFGVHLLV